MEILQIVGLMVAGAVITILILGILAHLEHKKKQKEMKEIAVRITRFLKNYDQVQSQKQKRGRPRKS